MRENRIFREEQYAKRRHKDYEEAYTREQIMAIRSMEDYEKQTSLHLAQHLEILDLKAAHKHYSDSRTCEGIVHQIIDLCFKVNAPLTYIQM
jgi:hypothetical protein